MHETSNENDFWREQNEERNDLFSFWVFSERRRWRGSYIRGKERHFQTLIPKRKETSSRMKRRGGGWNEPEKRWGHESSWEHEVENRDQGNCNSHKKTKSQKEKWKQQKGKEVVPSSRRLRHLLLSFEAQYFRRQRNKKVSPFLVMKATQYKGRDD